MIGERSADGCVGLGLGWVGGREGLGRVERGKGKEEEGSGMIASCAFWVVSPTVRRLRSIRL